MPHDYTSIDVNANKHFLDSEVSKIDGAITNKIKNGTHSVSKTQIRGEYKFSWGTVTERIAGSFIIWSFKISALAKIYEKDPGECFKLSMQAFKQLEEAYPEHSTEQPILVAGLYNNWSIYPGTSGEAFVIATSFQSEHQARVWVSSHILSEAILDIVAMVRNHSDML